jgi:hypothetical protein
MAPIDLQETEITKLSEPEVRVLQRHLNEVLEGSAFKSSHRSSQFLKYIVDQSIAGSSDLLKERLIGIELFGRTPSYDTGEDAIVRVTASEVRKRLLQHYGSGNTRSEYRLTLPLGSYVPCIARSSSMESPSIETLNGDAGHFHGAKTEAETNESLSAPAHEVAESSTAISADLPKVPSRPRRRWWYFAALMVLNVGAWFALRGSYLSSAAWPISTLPWSALFSSSSPVIVITSDPNIAEIQGFTGGEISLSDYANHNYLSGPNTLTPEQERFCKYVLRGDKASSVDVPIAVGAGELAESVSHKINVRGARDVELTDLKADTNFIILGSPRSDPWSGMFSDQLDFRFVFDANTGKEYILNAHPRPREQPAYVATAPGWATGQSYAIVALLQNPDSSGRVLLLAGANAEGTEAAGKLVTNRARLIQALNQCALQHSRVATNFEMLLRLDTMAGSPSHVDVVACHVLGSGVPH